MLYLHLGLHKTATTSLQKQVFPYIPNIIYLGRVYDGFNSSEELYKEICEYCFSSAFDLTKEKELISKLKTKTKNNDYLISEEWFTSDYSGLFGFEEICWQQKLTKLSRLISQCEVKVLISLREPTSAIYSQYCEFKAVKLKYETAVDYALCSNDALVFDYSNLDIFINRLFGKPTYLSFDRIITGKCNKVMSEFFGKKIATKITNNHEKVKADSGVEVNINNRTIDNIIKLIPKSTLTTIREFHIVKSAYKCLHKVMSKKTVVEYLTKEERRYLDSVFMESKEFYDNI